MTAVFITATGTDIGKTFIARGMIHQLRARGRTVEALKPVITGFDPRTPQASDTGRLLLALGQTLTPELIAEMSPYRLRAPLSPDIAARREGTRIDFAALDRPLPPRRRAPPRCPHHRGHRRHHGAARRSPYRARLDGRARSAADPRRRQLCRHAQPHFVGARRARPQRAQGRRRRGRTKPPAAPPISTTPPRPSAASPPASRCSRCRGCPKACSTIP